ncbi:YbjN domain-containing protein [Vallitalea pronyensis]|uniref:YbjN domain-containing protein n=1 Tax=Vallitalea pronyensis TaxID=1348613 RepID=A0A8J8MHF5_9FIRM|nr:YbjN domain-containing protein [Vallitalea pronyensis]QUI21690.1 YbjN domain-containing protein [Vallitalea pronyensis]
MDVKQKIEGYMIDMNLLFEELDEGTWRIEDDLTHIDNIVVKVVDPIVVFRVKVMTLPDKNREALYQTVLEMNANDLVHGAYAIENDNLVIIDTLQSENLDKNEFQSTIDSIGLALIQQYDTLAQFI